MVPPMLIVVRLQINCLASHMKQTCAHAVATVRRRSRQGTAAWTWHASAPNHRHRRMQTPYTLP